MTTPSHPARTGNRRQSLIRLALVTLVAIVFADVVARLVFVSLGQTPAEAAWNYVLVLYLCLGVTATGVALRAILQPVQPIATSLQTLSAATAGALTGFYYGGSLTDNNAGWAIVGAIIISALAAIVSARFASLGVTAGIAVAGTIAAYGFTFVLWSWAVAFLTTHHPFQGISLALLTLLYLWLTVQNFISVLRQIWR